MKASLDHLPEDKRAKVAAIAEVIRAEAPEAAMIVLFGSHARGDWVEDPETGYRSDYDLLVVIESAEVAEDHALWSRVEAAAREVAAPSPVTLIVHEFRELNQQIRRGQFFVTEVWEQGVVLYDSKRFTLARPKAATPEERKALAEEYFEHWRRRGRGLRAIPRPAPPPRPHHRIPGAGHGDGEGDDSTAGGAHQAVRLPHAAGPDPRTPGPPRGPRVLRALIDDGGDPHTPAQG
jgi:predicted nucleotidyltransferase